MKQPINARQLLITIILIIVFPILIFATQSIQQLLSKASGTNANIDIDANSTSTPIDPIWNAFAQGGEESKDMLAPVVDKVKKLKPSYIRIDHIYSHFDIVKKDASGKIFYDFSQLDPLVKSILATGATPYISLSYMPAVIAQNHDILSKPNNWQDWQNTIAETVKHYSSPSGLNLDNVIYEVWNEPDLFGKWNTYGDKNYLTLFEYASLGANSCTNCRNFQIGGPATTAFYKNWIEALIKTTQDKKLRLDFFSWHKYTKDVSKFTQDIVDFNAVVFNYPLYLSLPRYISEWGFSAEIDSAYDENLTAAHTIACIKAMQFGVDKALTFELVDGLDPQKHEYWGRWGLLTYPSFGAHEKPRYYAFLLLNKLIGGNKLSVSGEGTWIQAIAVKNDQKIKILLVNYDLQKSHTEDVPVKITNLINGKYEITQTRLDQSVTKTSVDITDGIYAAQIIMPQNSVVLIEINPV